MRLRVRPFESCWPDQVVTRIEFRYLEDGL